MKVETERVSLKKDGKTWCRPSDGYNNDSVEIDLSDYDEIATISEPLSANDAEWPKGAPLPNVVRFEDKILKRKGP